MIIAADSGQYLSSIPHSDVGYNTNDNQDCTIQTHSFVMLIRSKNQENIFIEKVLSSIFETFFQIDAKASSADIFSDFDFENCKTPVSFSVVVEMVGIGEVDAS